MNTNTNTNYSYRKYCVSDADSIYKLHKKVFKYSKFQHIKMDFLKKLEGYVIINHKNDNHKIIAYLVYSRNISQKRNNELWIYLEYIGVHPKYQGSGLGKILIDLFTDDLDSNLDKLPSYLDVEDDTNVTERLIKWYMKSNYVVVKPHMKANKEDVFMTRMVRQTKECVWRS